ncbi:hypothetical protein C1932_03000 [Stenotrophomonas sp. YAU14D1_LEIMI4_1]|nr:hypothetical protein C1932_03000 [Stenotrophomonas sp. YAU14D1_LEIMI4_1]
MCRWNWERRIVGFGITAETPILPARPGGGVLAGLAALHPLGATATATSTSKAGYPWVGGVGPVAGDAASTSL